MKTTKKPNNWDIVNHDCFVDTFVHSAGKMSQVAFNGKGVKWTMKLASESSPNRAHSTQV